MRFLPSARIVVFAADPDHLAFLCSALSALGLSRVLPAASLSDARRLESEGRVDLCVVDERGLAGTTANSQQHLVSNPFEASRTPAILIAEDTSVTRLQAATAAGYCAVLGVPVVPRLLYRRIGSILQKTRRADPGSNLAVIARHIPAGVDSLKS